MGQSEVSTSVQAEPKLKRITSLRVKLSIEDKVLAVINPVPEDFSFFFTL